MTYRCTFIFGGRTMFAESMRLNDFTSGFWIDSQHRFTQGHDGAIWIPPHKIEYVEKHASASTPPGRPPGIPFA